MLAEIVHLPFDEHQYLKLLQTSGCALMSIICVSFANFNPEIQDLYLL